MLGTAPRVVLVVRQDTPAVAKAVARGVDMIEARVDQLRDHSPVAAVAAVTRLKRYGLPLIGTVRCAAEGGAANLPDAHRAELYDAISPLVDIIDTELRSARALAQTLRRARRNGNLIMLSSHDFTATPPMASLARTLRQAIAAGADIVKIATMATSRADVARLFEFTARHRDRRLVVIGMGPVGSITRLALPLVGSLLTYTNLQPVDGQIPLATLLAHLRVYAPAGERGQ